MESHLIMIKNYDNRMVCACSNCNQYIASPSNGNGYDYFIIVEQSLLNTLVQERLEK